MWHIYTTCEEPVHIEVMYVHVACRFSWYKFFFFNLEWSNLFVILQPSYNQEAFLHLWNFLLLLLLLLSPPPYSLPPLLSSSSSPGGDPSTLSGQTGVLRHPYQSQELSSLPGVCACIHMPACVHVCMHMHMHACVCVCACVRASLQSYLVQILNKLGRRLCQSCFVVYRVQWSLLPWRPPRREPNCLKKSAGLFSTVTHNATHMILKGTDSSLNMAYTHTGLLVSMIPLFHCKYIP